MAYAAAAAPTSRIAMYSQANAFPTATGAFGRLKRPNSVSLRVPAGCKVEPREIYDLCASVFELRPISLSKSTNGDIIITTKDSEQKKKIMKFAALKISSGETLGIFDPASTIAFINVYSVPFELHDDAVVRKLQKYGSVLSIRRGHHASMPECENGIRHLRMNLRRAIPSFIHFGSESFRVRYTGQPETCRRCDECGHNASSCKRSRCFNCGKMDHTNAACPLNKICAICGSARHDISECVEWIPHEEDFDNFGMDIHSQVMTAEGENQALEEDEKNENTEEEIEQGTEDMGEDEDDGNEADDDENDEHQSDNETEAPTLAPETEEEPTPSTLSDPVPPNPFANIAFNTKKPQTFSFTSSPTLFKDTQPDSLEELFSKRPPKVYLNPSSASPNINPPSQPTIPPSASPKPQRPPKKSSRKPTLPPKPTASKPSREETATQSDASSSSKRPIEESSGSSTVGSVIENNEKKKSSTRPPKKKSESFVSRITNKFNSNKD